MIGSLRGHLLDRTLSGEVLVEVQGVGYRVTVSPSTALDVGDIGGEVFLHVHHHIREDAQTLYGFTTRDERIAFEALLSAHGVGPALALAILSVHPPGSLARVLADDDLAALCLVPGVGKKTAQRLLVELKSKLDVPDLDDARSAPVGSAPAGGGSSRSDVHDALAGLGYGPDEIREALRDLPAEGDASALLKEALKRLAVAR
ncbi:Holliday junction branch migration protein RuvA [Actinomarinicola tropica]|uniref:Holliday junction branch migration complex subunit RuvA n=1 Tax=Actinomarinicola tropica TaxID=2789776 RepID=A0A5Q2RKP3_9ACTN|nr:Holliday junction branch migration protein RuvA [Actinomarinicola tropica]QGG95151.1 Holliday junction branch migration protein RuvA [Actinomarinicola tropica]